MKRHAYTKSEAKLALAAAHGLGCEREFSGKAGALDVARRMGCVQSDPLDVAGRNHDLTLQSRVKGYRPMHLHDLCYKDRSLFEYYCKMASIMPIEAWPEFGAFREKWGKKLAPFFREHARETREVLVALEDGPISSRGFKGAKKVDWWWGKTNVYKVVLEHLFLTGRAIIARRDAGVKSYGLAEKLVPRALFDAESPKGDTFRKAVALRVCRASRLAASSSSPEQWTMVGKSKCVGETLAALERDGKLIKLELDGWKGSLYAPIENENIWKEPPGFGEDAARFLAPLDPLLWNRKLFSVIYGHDYVWEVYKKAHERRWGYYCLPVMFDGDYVGLIEPWYGKKERRLEIRSFHLLDRNVQRGRLKRALTDELTSFASYLGAEKVLAGKVKL
ncbi:MAG: crosslink repair DNA glycosylase YcaQ family protein [Methanobacteriota archaeon]